MPRPSVPRSVGAAADEASQATRRAASSRTLERTARLGFLSRGFVYVFIGVVGVQIALGSGAGKEADQKGAFRSLSDSTGGLVLLWLIVVGFVGYALWRAAEAAIGHRSETDPRKRTVQRVISGIKAVIYLSLALTAVSIARGGGGGKEGNSWSAEVMKASGGRWLVGLAGLVIAGVGAFMLVQALKEDFAEDLETGRMSSGFRRFALALGKVGYFARGIAFGVLGILVVIAAVRFQPAKAEGLDSALKSMAQVPFGAVVLTLVGLGLAAFGCYSFVESRYRRIDTG